MRQDFLRRRNRAAHHPVNAMLNYGYAALGKPGSDCDCPGRARPEYWLPARLPAGAAGMVYDLVEPFRPVVDKRILSFIRADVFAPKDFVIDAKGVCRLHPELAKTVSGFAVPDAIIREGISSAATSLHVTDSR